MCLYFSGTLRSGDHYVYFLHSQSSNPHSHCHVSQSTVRCPLMKVVVQSSATFKPGWNGQGHVWIWPLNHTGQCSLYVRWSKLEIRSKSNQYSSLSIFVGTESCWHCREGFWPTETWLFSLPIIYPLISKLSLFCAKIETLVILHFCCFFQWLHIQSGSLTCYNYRQSHSLHSFSFYTRTKLMSVSM